MTSNTTNNYIQSQGTIQGNNFVSTVNTQGISPLTVLSTTLVSNLNAQYLNGFASSNFHNLSNVLAVSNGGTGLTSFTTGYIPFGSTSTTFNSTSNLFWDSTNNRLGINTNTPTQSLQIIGNILGSSNITATNQLISTVATGTPPFIVSSTTLVPNLNVSQLNNQGSAYYLALANATGTLSVVNGGTGLVSLTTGYIPFGNSATALSSSPNLFWDSTNNKLGINNNNPGAPLSVAINSSAPTPETTGITCYASNQSYPAVISCRQALGSYSSNAQTAYYSTDWAGVAGASWSWGINPNTSSNAITFDFKKNWNFTAATILSMSSITGYVGINNSTPTVTLDVSGAILAGGNNTVKSQGLHLQWNRGTNDACSYIMNQKAGGVGGIKFGEVDSNNTFTTSMYLYSNTLAIGGINLPQNTLDVQSGQAVFRGSTGCNVQIYSSASNAGNSELIFVNPTASSGTNSNGSWSMGQNSWGVGKNNFGFGIYDPNSSTTSNYSGLIMSALISNGNVGIKTSNPTTPLQIIASSATTPDLNGLSLWQPSSNVPAIIHLKQNYSTYASNVALPYISFDWSNVCGFSCGLCANTASSNITFEFKKVWNLAGSPVMAMSLATGYVGINTSNPQTYLDVVGSSTVSPLTVRGGPYRNIRLIPTANNSNVEILFQQNTAFDSLTNAYWTGVYSSSAYYGIFNNSNSGTPIASFTSNNQVGINTSNPSTALDVNGRITTRGITNSNIIIIGSALQAEIVLSNTSNVNVAVGLGSYNVSSNILALGNANHVVNTTNGYLGIGTSNPTLPLHVSSSVAYLTSNYGYLNGSTTTGPTGFQSGNNSFPCSIYGAGKIVSGIEFQALSDQRKKHNIIHLDYDKEINFIQKLNPVLFSWKNQIVQKQHYGFIAQQVAKLSDHSQLVDVIDDIDMKETVDEDEFLSPNQQSLTLNYQGFIPVLTKVVQHLLITNEQQQQRIKSLEQKIIFLEQKFY